ncbi:MAG: DUF4185 domain-containing protein [Deltaproteobacteria bacterium]|nr:DUF4185 domain-containing protein [Deltaproteobacteria bacterium]
MGPKDTNPFDGIDSKTYLARYQYPGELDAVYQYVPQVVPGVNKKNTNALDVCRNTDIAGKMCYGGFAGPIGAVAFEHDEKPKIIMAFTSAALLPFKASSWLSCSEDGVNFEGCAGSPTYDEDKLFQFSTKATWRREFLIFKNEGKFVLPHLMHIQNEVLNRICGNGSTSPICDIKSLWGGDTDEKELIMIFGTGMPYRDSHVYLAAMLFDHGTGALTSVKYWSKNNNGVISWRDNEVGATALIEGKFGELSVRLIEDGSEEETEAAFMILSKNKQDDFWKINSAKSRIEKCFQCRDIEGGAPATVEQKKFCEALLADTEVTRCDELFTQFPGGGIEEMASCANQKEKDYFWQIDPMIYFQWADFDSPYDWSNQYKTAGDGYSPFVIDEYTKVQGQTLELYHAICSWRGERVRLGLGIDYGAFTRPLALMNFDGTELAMPWPFRNIDDGLEGIDYIGEQWGHVDLGSDDENYEWWNADNINDRDDLNCDGIEFNNWPEIPFVADCWFPGCDPFWNTVEPDDGMPTFDVLYDPVQPSAIQLNNIVGLENTKQIMNGDGVTYSITQTTGQAPMLNMYQDGAWTLLGEVNEYSGYNAGNTMVYGNSAFFAGGIDDHGQVTNDVYVMSLSGRREFFKLGTAPKLSSSRLVVLSDSLYLVGNGSKNLEIHRYDENTGWTLENDSHPHTFALSAYSDGNELYIHGSYAVGDYGFGGDNWFLEPEYFSVEYESPLLNYSETSGLNTLVANMPGGLDIVIMGSDGDKLYLVNGPVAEDGTVKRVEVDLNTLEVNVEYPRTRNKILFVANGCFGQESEIESHLGALNYEVDILGDAEIDASTDLTQYNMVIITGFAPYISSAGLSNIQNSGIPVFIVEYWDFFYSYQLGLVTDEWSYFGDNTLDVLDPNHPITQGLATPMDAYDPSYYALGVGVSNIEPGVTPLIDGPTWDQVSLLVNENLNIVASGLHETHRYTDQTWETFDRCVEYLMARSSSNVCNLDYQEQFDANVLPAGWSIGDGDSDGYTWEWTDLDNNIGNGSSGGYYQVSSNAAGAVDMDELITTGLYERGECGQVFLQFNHLYQHESGDQAQVDIQVDSGAWQNIATYSSDITSHEDLNVTSYLGAGSTFRFRFRYVANDDKKWKVDDVRIVGTQ